MMPVLSATDQDCPKCGRAKLIVVEPPARAANDDSDLGESYRLCACPACGFRLGLA